MTDVAELLDTLAPPYEGTGDWNRVLRDAKLERRPLWRPYRLAAVAALVAVIAGVVALWPASNGTGGSVLDRALAATGGGAVLHLVYEGEQPRTLVDLETGERTELRSQHEVWFDPQAGLRQTETFDGVVQFDTVLGADEMAEHTTSIYSSLGAGYRKALESGRAEVVGEETVDGTPVYWIQHRGRPRRRRVPRHVRADLHPRHPERDAGADSDRHLRDRRSPARPRSTRRERLRACRT